MHGRTLLVAVAAAIVAQASGAVHHLIWTANGISNNHLVINAGDSVEWDNQDVGGHWALNVIGVNNNQNPIPTSTEPSPLDSGGASIPLAAGHNGQPILFPNPGFYPWHDQLNLNDAAFWGDIQTLGCQGICADPHFYGLDGVHYDFQGRPNETFALISDPSVEINSRFTESIHGTTTLGQTCVRVCNHSLILNPVGQTAFVDGQQLTVGQRFDSASMSVEYMMREFVLVQIPGRWNLRFHLLTDDLGAHTNLDFAEALYKYDGKTHGVLGHTLSRKPVPKEKCNIETEGSCEVEGSFKHYRVEGDICSAEWMYSQFNSAQC